MPEAARVRLAVFDTNGRLVKVLVDAVVPAGVSGFAWDGRAEDGSASGSGVYFCVAESEKFNETRKMVLLR
jgi:flagellar hook assembly protein FlgD